MPVTPQKVTDSNYAALGFTSSSYSAYKGWFAIRDAKELYGYAKLINSKTDQAAKGVLVQDIVVNETVSASGAAYTWTPINPKISASNDGYRGSFDGNGHYISGLYYNDSSTNDIGLIGNAKRDVSVSNLTIKNSYLVANIMWSDCGCYF